MYVVIITSSPLNSNLKYNSLYFFSTIILAENFAKNHEKYSNHWIIHWVEIHKVSIDNTSFSINL